MTEQVLRAGSELQGGKYRILGLLGQGGFGITYEAVQVSLDRKVAVKEFFMKGSCERAGDTSSVTVPTKDNRPLVDKFRAKFVREARLIAAMDHPHIVKIIEVFEENGTAYYVMESIQGGSLSSVIKSTGPLPEDVAIEYIRQIGSALKYVHEHNILHLDVKPANILLRKEGAQIALKGISEETTVDVGRPSSAARSKASQAVLIDFGISKHYDDYGLTTSSTPVGFSVGFAPSEQSIPGDISKLKPATDIYALGATLYCLVTGTLPPAATEVLNHGLERPQGVSDTVWNAIEKAMAPRIEDRPQNVDAFLALLSGKQPAKKRIALWAGIAAAVVAAVVCFFAFTGGKKGGESPQPPIADSTITAQEVQSAQDATLMDPEPAPAAEETYEIVVSSTPSGAKVFLNGKDQRETTPATLKELKAGTYKVTLKMDGYQDQTKTVTFKSGSPLQSKVALTLNKEPEKTGTAKIESTPSGATIYIDGRNTGMKTPEIIENLTVGSHSVKLTLEGYNDAGGTITVSADSRSNLLKILTAKPQQQSGGTTVGSTSSATGSGSGTGTIAGHQWVDLGLSVKWATTNVGASTPGAYGNYYAWGETSTKSSYDWTNLKYRTSGDSWDTVKFSKYNTDSSRGPVDNKTRLDLSDDAARANWGGSWRMPTDAEWTELRTKCTWTWTTQNGSNGYKVTAPNGNSIFLPATGWKGSTGSTIDAGSYGRYWSSSLNAGSPFHAWYVYFTSSYVYRSYGYRCRGVSVRPVSE